MAIIKATPNPLPSCWATSLALGLIASGMLEDSCSDMNHSGDPMDGTIPSKLFSSGSRLANKLEQQGGLTGSVLQREWFKDSENETRKSGKPGGHDWISETGGASKTIQ